ncbi:RnaseH-domain-containing protein [Lenzites betulinus]|nr:RnaseH-domain-containing protein [Lenzites betulinus]
MTIVTDSMYVYKGLTMHLEGWENKGWFGVANADILKKLVAGLRRRSAQTHLKWVKGHSGVPGNEEADRLAAHGTTEEERPPRRLTSRDRAFLSRGARLTTMTQKLAYKCIMDAKHTHPRSDTARSLGMVQDALGTDLGLYPTVKAIWSNIWNKDLSVKTASFFWKTMHNAYRVGEYWSNIPDYEHRAECCVCKVPETMEHILSECSAPGQELLWDMAMSILRDGGDARERGRKRLTRIVLSETAHLIWKARCERVIEGGNNASRRPPAEALQARWLKTMNERLNLDICCSSKKWKDKRISKEVVLNTWRGTLLDEGSLPDDWTGTAGVLVGTLRRGDRRRPS